MPHQHLGLANIQKLTEPGDLFDTIVVFDTHWLVNANYHINCGAHFKGLYTSNELPHFISNMAYGFAGNPELGKLLAKVCNEWGVETLAHDRTTLAPEYGTLVPMRYMNTDRHFKVVSVSAMCMAHYLNDSARLGWAIRRAIEERYDGTVAVFASGSLSHRFAQNGLAPEYAFRIWSPFLETLDREVVRGEEPVGMSRRAGRARGGDRPRARATVRARNARAA